MDLAQGRPVGVRRNNLLPVDLGMEDLVDHADRSLRKPSSDGPSEAAQHD